MAKESRPHFDPRFDPAFQRGYKPKPGEAVRVRQPRAVEPAPEAPSRAEPGAASRSAPIQSSRMRGQPSRRTVEPDPLGIERAHLAAIAEAELASYDPPTLQAPQERFDEAESLQVQVETEPAVNVFVIVLWLIAGIFTVVGTILLISAVYALVTSSPINAFDRTMDELGIYLSAPLLTVGLGTAVGLLFLSAVRSGREHGHGYGQ